MTLIALVLAAALAVSFIVYRVWREQVHSLINEAELYANVASG